MKSHKFTLVCLAAALLLAAGLAQGKLKEEKTMTEKSPIDTIFAQGEVNPYSKFFTGTTYLTMLSLKDNVWNAPIGNVTFEPGARTHWHKHDGGQILLVLNGEGRYQEKGKEIRTLKRRRGAHRARRDSLARGRAGQLVCAHIAGNQRAPKRFHRLAGPGNRPGI